MTLGPRRKEVMTAFTTVPLLVIDDLGVRRLPTTALRTCSNRPVEDWGKLLGDTAAVFVLLDTYSTTCTCCSAPPPSGARITP